MEALKIIKQLGAEKKLSDEQEAKQIHIIFSQAPEEAGIGIFADWAALLACALAEERFGAEYTDIL